MINSACVYCASGKQVDAMYFTEAFRLGTLFALHGIRCFYGGGSVGLMGALAEGVLSNGGKATGIIPRFMCEREWHHTALTELIMVETMHERKQLMMQSADVLIALPGGIGTFEELIEAITWRKLNLIDKPIYIVNTNNYYRNLIVLLKQAIEEKFMELADNHLWTVVPSADALITKLLAKN